MYTFHLVCLTSDKNNIIFFFPPDQIKSKQIKIYLGQNVLLLLFYHWIYVVFYNVKAYLMAAVQVDQGFLSAVHRT